jgi:glycosyltransferase involved in cell wall biosynthesis
VGTTIRIMKVPQILWYSHSIADLPLKISQSVPNLIVSSNLNTVPVRKNSKVRAIGHGIEVSRFKEEKDLLNQKREGIIALGRIVPVKNLEKLLEVITILTPEARKAIGDIKLIGPSGINLNYEAKLNQMISKESLNVSFFGGLSYTKIPKILESTSILYSGTPQSVDKVCLEAAMSGCLIVSDNSSVQELTGMRDLFPTESIRKNLQLQLEWISDLSESDIVELRREVIRKSRSSNSLDSLVLKVSSLFEEIETSSSLE